MSQTPWTRADTEAVACCVCHREGRPVHDLDPFGIVRCDRCSLVFVSPRLRTELDRTAAAPAGRALLRRRRIAARVRLALRELGGPVEGARLLDLGDDAFATAAAAAGFDVVCSAPDRMDVGGTFDVITAWDVLDRAPDPVETWHRLAKLLDGDGAVLFSTTDYASLPSRIRHERWRELRPDVRVWQFTAKTHRIVAGTGGLEVTELYRGPWHGVTAGRLGEIVGVARPA